MQVRSVTQSPEFFKTVKKLYKNQKADLDKAVGKLIDDPLLGELKNGDLSEIRVYKFRMNKQLSLLAYRYYKSQLTLHMLAAGGHENFYRDLKS